MGLIRAFLEAIRGLWRTGMVGVLSVATIGASLLVLGVFGQAMTGGYALVEQLRERVEIDIYLEDQVSRRRALALAEDLEAMPGVSGLRYIDKAAAAEEFREMFGGGMLDALSQNPLPTSIRVKMVPGSDMTAQVRALSEVASGWQEVESVDVGESWVEMLDWTLQIAVAVGVLLGGVLCLACTFAVSNTAKLMVLSQREAIEIMRLVGATGGFIRMTFLVGGGLQGLAGGLMATLCLSYVAGWWALRVPDWALEPPFDLGLGLIGLGTVLGVLGSWTSLSRVLNAVTLK